MNTIKERVNKSYVDAFKNKDVVAKNVLSVVKSEIANKEKSDKIENLSDSDVIAILKKNLKTLKDNVEKYGSNDEWNSEISVIESFLPKQMSEDEIRIAVNEITLTMNFPLTKSDMGKIMGQFNGKFPGLADGKLLSNIVKEALL